jgi:hypothetical protein
MQRFIRFANEFTLSLFFVGILALATVTTVGLSPIGLAPANDVSANQILGVNTDTAEFTASLIESTTGAELKYQENTGYYLYNETLPANTTPGIYQKSFVILENNTNQTQEWEITSQVPTQFADIIKTSIVGPNGDAYALQSPRTMAVPASSKVSYTIRYELVSAIGFNLPISVILAPLQR